MTTMETSPMVGESLSMYENNSNVRMPAPPIPFEGSSEYHEEMPSYDTADHMGGYHQHHYHQQQHYNESAMCGGDFEDSGRHTGEADLTEPHDNSTPITDQKLFFEKMKVRNTKKHFEIVYPTVLEHHSYVYRVIWGFILILYNLFC